MVDGERPSRRAIERIDSPAARASAISSRSAKVTHRPFRSRPRRGRTPPAARTHFQPTPAMRPDHRRGVGEKLTTRERRPEPLVDLGHHPRLEDRHLSHTPVVAF